MPTSLPMTKPFSVLRKEAQQTSIRCYEFMTQTSIIDTGGNLFHCWREFLCQTVLLLFKQFHMSTIHAAYRITSTNRRLAMTAVQKTFIRNQEVFQHGVDVRLPQSILTCQSWRKTTRGLQLGLLAAVPPHTSQQPVSRLLLNSFREAAPVSWILTPTRGTTLCRSMIQIKFDEILTANYFHHACGLTANLCKFIVRCAPFFADLERMKQR